MAVGLGETVATGELLGLGVTVTWEGFFVAVGVAVTGFVFSVGLGVTVTVGVVVTVTVGACTILHSAETLPV